MSDDVKKVYQAMYSPILTPYNLVDNAKLSNYNYVKFYKDEIGLTVEMECDMENEECRVFYYCFDEKDYLQKIYIHDNNEKVLVFSRDNEINKAKQEYYNNKEILTKVI